MLLVAQVDVARLETPEGLLDHAHLFGGTPMVYDGSVCRSCTLSNLLDISALLPS